MSGNENRIMRVGIITTPSVLPFLNSFLIFKTESLVSISYSTPLNRRLTVQILHIPVRRSLIKLKRSKNFKTMKITFKYSHRETGEENVNKGLRIF